MLFDGAKVRKKNDICKKKREKNRLQLGHQNGDLFLIRHQAGGFLKIRHYVGDDLLSQIETSNFAPSRCIFNKKRNDVMT